MSGSVKYDKAAALINAGHADAAVADAMGVSERTLRRWRSDGKIPEPQRDQRSSEVTLAEARRRKEAALAVLRELEVKKKTGELVDADEVAHEWAERARAIRERFLAWPGRVAAELAADLEVEAGDVSAALEGYVREFLIELADDPRGENHESA